MVGPPFLATAAAGIAAVILLVTLARVFALDHPSVFAARAGEQAFRAADAGIALEIARELGRLLGGS